MTVSTKQARIAQKARIDPCCTFTSLNHLIDEEWLHEAYRCTRKDAATGVDGVTAEKYAENLNENLRDLLNRAKSGTYRAPPVRRCWIHKSEHEKRPIGIQSFEDKVLSRAVAMVLEPIYEQEFLPCSYGFRPGLGVHDALADLWSELADLGGCWVLDVDVRQYFDSIDKQHLCSILSDRMRDGVISRLIHKWLKAGVWDAGAMQYDEFGTPQGSVISPMLSNIYLHDVLDKWFHDDVRPRLRGRAFLIRFADDFVIVCERRDDAERVHAVLPSRFNKFGLTIHPEKTRLVDFRSPAQMEPGEHPETFDFLGFTHYWGKTRRGKPLVHRKTSKKKLRNGVTKLETWCKENRHLPVSEQHRKLSEKLRGHMTHFGLTGNFAQIKRVYRETRRAWRRWLERRTRGRPLTWETFARTIEHLYPLPRPRITWTIDKCRDRQQQRRRRRTEDKSFDAFIYDTGGLIT